MLIKSHRFLALLVFGAVVSGMVAAVLLLNFGATGVVEAVSGFVTRWFFAVFCVVFAIAQARVYLIRRREEARVARHVPAGPFGLFTVVWMVLAGAGIVYGIVEPGHYWEIAGWITITLVVCSQLFVLGGIEQSFRSDAEGDGS